MAVRMGDNSMERIERIAGAAAGSVKKAIGDVAGDVKESLGLEKLQAIPQPQQQQIKQDEQARARLIRQNIVRIDREVEEIRKKRQEQEQQQKQVQARKKEEKKIVEKKKSDSVLARLIKSREGTKEGMQRASG